METKKVKCINFRYVNNELILNKIYDVKKEDEAHYYVVNEQGKTFGYYKHQFLIVTDYVSDSTTAINPKHYQLPIEPKDFIIKNELGFCEGNVIKYICRYKQKNGVEDLKKAKQYIDFLIDEIETKSNR